MEINKKALGIIFIILGLIFVIWPIYSGEVVSLVLGLCLIAFGFVSFVDGFSAWSIVTHVSAVKIIVGIIAILIGLVFLYNINAIPILVGLEFYIIALIMIIIGILGLVSESTMSKVGSILIFIMGIIAIFLALYSIAQPIYTTVLVGICIIIDGICFIAEA